MRGGWAASSLPNSSLGRGVRWGPSSLGGGVEQGVEPHLLLDYISHINLT